MMIGSARRPGQGRARVADRQGRGGGAPPSPSSRASPTTVEDYVRERDFAGALALAEFNVKSGTGDRLENLMWAGYAAFHLTDYHRALGIYREIAAAFEQEMAPEVHLFEACCLYYLGMHDRAEEAALKGPNGALRNRILLHAAHRANDEDKLMRCHQKIGSESKEDQLSLAAVHYLRSNFQEAADIYKGLLLENRSEDVALNVYVAMCYYKLDYYDVSLEILAVYLQAFPDSAIAINLKACNSYKLYNGAAASQELQTLVERGHRLAAHDLIAHNAVVFDEGKQALQKLPSLVGSIPQARLNLVIYHLRRARLCAHDGPAARDAIREACSLVRDLEPSTPQEYILKAVANATGGQLQGNREQLKRAQQFFQLVGASASECDTIPGRQCMASCFFLLKQFDDVHIYLNSIRTYMYGDDDFNWNFGISLAARGGDSFRAAEEALLLVQSEVYTRNPVYVAWLARCHIMNGNPGGAWELHLKALDREGDDGCSLLQLIANDCYRMGHFLYAAKAFDALERRLGDYDAEIWEGKRGAVVGVFQMVLAGTATKSELVDALAMVRGSSNPEGEHLARVISKHCAEAKISLPLT